MYPNEKITQTAQANRASGGSDAGSTSRKKIKSQLVLQNDLHPTRGNASLEHIWLKNVHSSHQNHQNYDYSFDPEHEFDPYPNPGLFDPNSFSLNWNIIKTLTKTVITIPPGKKEVIADVIVD